MLRLLSNYIVKVVSVYAVGLRVRKNGCASIYAGFEETGRFFSRIALPLLIAAGLASSAGAAVVDSRTGNAVPNSLALRQHLVLQMMAHPGDVDLALQYAALAAQAGDLEGAISTLERLLIFSPNLARLNFQLGVLYYQLGSFDASTAYFKAATDAPDSTPAIKAEVDTYLSSASVRTAENRGLGVLMFGARYQTNANGGAGSSSIDLNGVDFLLSDAAIADPDSNGFASANYHFSKDLASQGDHFDVDLSGYGSVYGKHDELDTLAGEIHAGPTFNLAKVSIANSMLGFYGILGGVGLKGVPYLYSVGLGTVLTTNSDPQTLEHARFEYRYNDFMNSADRPDVANMSGPRLRLSGDVRRQMSDGLSLYGTLYVERVSAAIGMDADWEVGGTVGTTVRLLAPMGIGAPWSLDASAGLLQRAFDTPDPTTSSDRRLDREVSAQLALTVPVGQGWSAVGTLAYRRSLSNYDLYSFDDKSVSLAMSRGF